MQYTTSRKNFPSPGRRKGWRTVPPELIIGSNFNEDQKYDKIHSLCTAADAACALWVSVFGLCVWHLAGAGGLYLAVGARHQPHRLCRVHAIRAGEPAVLRRVLTDRGHYDHRHQQPAHVLWPELSFPLPGDGRALSLYGVFAHRRDLLAPVRRQIPCRHRREHGGLLHRAL